MTFFRLHLSGLIYLVDFTSYFIHSSFFHLNEIFLMICLYWTESFFYHLSHRQLIELGAAEYREAISQATNASYRFNLLHLIFHPVNFLNYMRRLMLRISFWTTSAVLFSSSPYTRALTFKPFHLWTIAWIFTVLITSIHWFCTSKYSS